MADQVTKVGLSQEIIGITNAKNGSDTRQYLVGALNKMNQSGDDADSLYDGENYILAHHLLTKTGAEKALKNNGDKGQFTFVPIGNPSTKTSTVTLFFDVIPEKESEKKYPMTSRGLYTNLEIMDQILDKIIGPKTKDWNDLNV